LAQAQAQAQKQQQVNPAPVPVPEAPTAKNTKKKGGGNMKCSRDELETLLDALEEVMPIGKVDWEKVESMCNLQVPEERERTLLKLQNQCNTLCSKRPPTGNPNCPPEVKCAKRISYKIKDKAGCEALASDAPPRFESETAEDVARGQTNGTKKMAAAAAAAAAVSTPTYKKVNKSRSDTSDLSEAFLATERIQAEREQRRDDRSHAESKQWMQLAVNGASAFALAIAGKKVPDHAVGAMLPSPFADDGTSTVSSDSDISFNTCLKRRKMKKKARKQKEKHSKVLSDRKKRVAKNACSKVLEHDSHSDNELTHDLCGKPILTQREHGKEEDEDDEDNGGGEQAAKQTEKEVEKKGLCEEVVNKNINVN